MNKDLNTIKEFDNSHEKKSSFGIKQALVEALVFILTLAIIAPIALYTVHYAFGDEASPFVVSGMSMDPTLDDGQMVIVNKTNEAPQNGDIVVTLLPEEGYKYSAIPEAQYIVKRVLAGPGDIIDIGVDDSVTVNGIVIEEPYLSETAKNATYVPNHQTHYELTDGEYFVAGDNRANSCDSRYFGVVKHEEITGVVNENSIDVMGLLFSVIKYAIGIIVLYFIVEKVLTVALFKVFKV